MRNYSEDVAERDLMVRVIIKLNITTYKKIVSALGRKYPIPYNGFTKL
jgi:hypothetical protein